jgi:hypothetical protein
MNVLNHDPREILRALADGPKTRLGDLPGLHGLYGLRDHVGEIRYIGITESPAMGFKRRINNYHAAGDEIHSHKFSRAYCTGRMWRDRSKLGQLVNGVEQPTHYARKAKALRRFFIRTYCSASYVHIPPGGARGDYFRYLESLETAVKRLAPDGMRLWDGHSFQPLSEPTELVDEAIRVGQVTPKSGFTAKDFVAFDHQCRLYQSLTGGA